MPARLRSIEILIERNVVQNKRMAYHCAANWLPAGVVVRLGDRVLINEERLDAYLERGGSLGQAELSPDRS